jgi:hypothetical protein
MKNTEILSRINALLNRKVKLEQMTLENGTVIEAEIFEVGQPIFAIDGENKTPLEVGEYVMADGMKLYVTEVGVIGEIAMPTTEEAEGETEASKKKGYDMAEVPATLEEILTAVVDAIQPKLDEMQAKIDALSGGQTEMKETLSKTSAIKPTTHKPTELKREKVELKSNDVQARIFAQLSLNN